MDPKSSVIDIVQAVDRALRQSYQQGKVSWVVIPVYLPSPEVHAAGEGGGVPVERVVGRVGQARQRVAEEGLGRWRRARSRRP
ncbi:hypothetical protein ACIPLC_37810 [Kitasatospora sp. NPDC086801]|uniref:hypothetical protein n=1 Tax=Kitasatospora sp. NPDC086801 TaxID=3364066 RepID=UPI00382CB2B0